MDLQVYQQTKAQDSIFHQFTQWFAKNGGKSRKIIFPARFAPTNYIGIKAQTSIKSKQVFLAIPKCLIITPSKVRASQLSSILSLYDLDKKSEENQFNLLVLFIIWNKMLGQKSFFHPYLKAVGKAETIKSWSDIDIEALCDPFITVEFVNELRDELSGTYKRFQTISRNHPELFKQQITLQMFNESYEIVVTRCFGWGLPETMMVPYADFLNHNCHGVYHYVLNTQLEKLAQPQQLHKQYILKKNSIDLSLLQIESKEILPEQLFENRRQKLLKKYRITGEQKTKIKSYIEQQQKIKQIQGELLRQSFQVELIPSSDSEDNDSEPDAESQDPDKSQIRGIVKLAKQQMEQKFVDSKPEANQQFNNDVTFNWWSHASQQHSYFIVAAHRDIEQNEQIFNSYGRRNNRFLLIWYGFTHQDNKYDSLAFRFWKPSIYEKTGHLLFVRYLTEKDWNNKIRLGNERYGIECLSDEFRLKRYSLCYELMAYLRHRMINKKHTLKKQFEKYPDAYHIIHSLRLQKMMLQEYTTVLKHISRIYQLDRKRSNFSNENNRYFGTVLYDSYVKIFQNHVKGVKILRNVIEMLEEGSSLLVAYRGILSQKQGQCEKQKIQNRRFTLDYFKMLSKLQK